MKIVKTIDALRASLKEKRNAGQTIGFVPTMGYLHDGHLSLVKTAREATDVVVVSIFVNPTQFGPGEDLDSYPRDLERDTDLLAALDVDFVFFPPVEEMYPEGYGTYIAVESGLTETLCGASRPGHFKGVTTVVGKLFNIVQPDKAFFGQKDAQQVAVIRRMVKDLNMPVEIVPVPIVRESDGLALSSRNTYLTPGLRQEALVLSRAIQEAQRLFEVDKVREASIIISAMTDIVSEAEHAVIDYIEIVDNDQLKPVGRIEGDVLVAMAVWFDKTRLIDNTVLEV